MQIYFLEDLIIQKIDMGVCNLSFVPPGTWFSLISDVESEAESEAESGANLIFIEILNCDTCSFSRKFEKVDPLSKFL